MLGHGNCHPKPQLYALPGRLVPCIRGSDPDQPPLYDIMTFRRVAIPLRGPGHPFFSSRAASGRCVLTATAACVPCGVVSAFSGAQ